MKVAAVITEYNPFHNGHLYQLETIRQRYGADHIIVIMSGDFIQRGGPAFTDKYLRTRMALLGGADLVIELPTPFATSESSVFARGAVHLLDRLGVVDRLFFGCETCEPFFFNACSDILIEEPKVFRNTLKEAVKNGASFPRARAYALSEAYNAAHPGQYLPQTFLSSPNNILALEYYLALKQEQSAIQPMPLLRKGAGYHDKAINGTFASATGIRKALLNDDPSGFPLSEAVPPYVLGSLDQAFGIRCPIIDDDFSQIFASAFLSGRLHPEEMENCYFGKTMYRRMLRQFDGYTVLSDYLSQLKTKSWTRTRIDRSVFRMMLHIPRDYGRRLLEEHDHPWEYIRILGFRKDSTGLLHRIKATSQAPLISKMADAPQKLPSEALSVLDKDIYAADLYRYVQQSKFHTVLKNEWRQPIIQV